MKEALKYLSDLERNNSRDWFRANEKRYRDADAGFDRLLERLMAAIGAFDGSVARLVPKEVKYRLVRDVRFSRDKTPYTPGFRAHMAASGKKPIPVGYYISIAPGDRSFLAGGLHAAGLAEATAMIRDRIAARGDELEAVLKGKRFASLFTLEGEKLKNVPRGYDRAHPQAELLKHKSWYAVCPVSDGRISKDGFVEEAAKIYRAVKPFGDFLNSALKGFVMPSR
jgi:uncharacterized protein (TIGR02453 family)